MLVCHFLLHSLPISEQICNSTAREEGKAAPAGIYKKSTGGGNLRTHIDKNHSELYLEQASSRGWVNKLPSQTRSRTDATDRTSELSRPDDFTITKLHGALVKFVTTDDQV